MPVSERSDKTTVEALYHAMQVGPGAEETILDLFADDGVLVESMTGQARRHAGKPAIRDCLAGMWRTRAPDLVLNLDRVDVDGETVRAEWTCTSSMMPGPMRGRDVLTVRSGKVARLEIVVTEMPGFGP